MCGGQTEKPVKAPRELGGGYRVTVTAVRRVFRLLLIEDDVGRVQDFRAWLPPWAMLVWAQSAGAALGLI